MSQSPSNQVVAITANTAATVTSAQWYAHMIVTNQTADPIYCRADGGTASSTEGGFQLVIEGLSWRMVANDQVAQPLVNQSLGSTVQNKGYQGTTEPNLNPLASGSPTHLSIIGAASGNVAVEFV